MKRETGCSGPIVPELSGVFSFSINSGSHLEGTFTIVIPGSKPSV